MPGIDISHHVWSANYRHRDGDREERTITETCGDRACRRGTRRRPSLLGRTLPRHPRGFQVPAGRARPGRRRHGAQCHPRIGRDFSTAEFRQIYDLAYATGLKGCTTFRPNAVTGSVLTEAAEGADAPPLLRARARGRLIGPAARAKAFEQSVERWADLRSPLPRRSACRRTT
jgi:hypothetical protein